METTKKFNKRAFVSVGMLAAGISLPISGLMNHLHGFETLTSARHFWMSIHNMSAFLFTIFAVIHASLNWRSITNYFTKIKGDIISKEAIMAIALVLIIIILFSLHAFRVR